MYSTHASGPTLRDLAEDADVLTMGITPSADQLHQGHYLTLFNLLKTLSDTRTATARIFLDDREFNNQVEPSVPSESRIRSIERLIGSFAERTEKYLHDSTLGSRITTERMSDFWQGYGAQHETMGGDMYKLLTTEWQFKIAPSYRNSLKRVFRTVCPDCSVGKLKTRGLRNQSNGFRNVCIEPTCSNGEYFVDAIRGDTNWLVHYALVGLRDVPFAEFHDASILHVYGGDYAQKWGGGGRESKARRMSDTVARIRAKKKLPPIHHHAGPLILNGHDKLSKSKGDGGVIPDFEWMEAVLNGKSSEVDVAAAD